VTQRLLDEKVYARLKPGANPTPDSGILRAVRSNLRYHMSYISIWHERRWLAGESCRLPTSPPLRSCRRSTTGEVPGGAQAAGLVCAQSRRAFR
jgi:hypothetical protein